MVSGVSGSDFTGLSFWKEHCVLAIDYRLVVQPSDLVQQVSNFHLFHLITQAEPLAHHWEVLSYPVQLQPTLGIDLNITSEPQGAVFQHSKTIETIVHLISSIPLRSAATHRTEFSFCIHIKDTVQMSPVFTKYRDQKWPTDPKVLYRDPDHHLNQKRW